MSEQGTCTTCGEKLHKLGLRQEDRVKVRSSIVQIAARNGAAEVRIPRYSCMMVDTLARHYVDSSALCLELTIL